MTADDRGPFWLQGDEDGGVRLMCRLCDTGGAPVRFWLDPPPGPVDVDGAARAHHWDAHPPTPEVVQCSVDYPVTQEQVLGWAQQTKWLLRSYHKFTFTFEAYCTVAYPDDPEAHEVEALAVISGQPEDFYRFSAGPDTVTWDQLCYVRTPDLELRDGDKTLIVLTGGDLE